jgi:hypothetical protein
MLRNRNLLPVVYTREVAKMRTWPPCALLMVVALLGGCAFFTVPKENPVQQDYVGSFLGDRNANVFSLTSERRTILVMRQMGLERKDIWFCAEPPPDVAESLTSTFRALAEASVKGGGPTTVNASIELSKSLATVTSSLFARSQGIQLFRDGLFNLCQATINGFVKPEEYAAKYSALLEKSMVLIEKEIPSIVGNRADIAAERAEKASANANAAQQKAEAARDDATAAATRAEKAAKAQPPQ